MMMLWTNFIMKMNNFFIFFFVVNYKMDDIDYAAVQRARKSQAKEMEERQRQMEADFAKALEEFERKQQKKPVAQPKPFKRSKIVIEKEEEPMKEEKMEMPKQPIKAIKKEPKKQEKKAEKVKEMDKMDIRTHLKTLTWMELKNLAKITNLHFHISLKSKSDVIEGLAKLYEHRNGIYTTKPFEAIQKDGKMMKKPISIKKKASKTSAIDASLEEWAKQFEK